MFLKLIKGKIFALSPKPRPIWGLCLRDGLVSVFTVCLSLCGLLLAAGEKPSVCPSPRPAYPLTGVFIVVRAFVSLNCLTRAREIAANTWEREQGSYLLKEGTVAKWSREGDLGRIPFSSEIQHTLRPFRKALGVVGPYLG